MGWADSFRFLKAHPHIPRIILSNEEKLRLIDESLIHPILKNRDVSVIPVVFAFKLFGSKILRSIRRDGDEYGGSRAAVLAELSMDMNDNTGYGRGVRRNGEMVGSQLLVERYKMERGPLIKNLKPVEEPAVLGSDWIYRCALSAAEYNAHLKLERYDRLWGWARVQEEEDNDRKSDQDGDSDDDLFDSDSEGGSVAQRKKDSSAASTMNPHNPANPSSTHPQQSYQRTGFFDVHTGVNQIPRATQIESIRVEGSGITRHSFKSAVESNPSSSVPLHIGPNPPPLPSGASVDARTALGLTSDGDAKLYPLALVPGQYQEAFSVYVS
jgi:hypothetical protein